MSKGIFIEGITVEMFRNASLEAVEDLMNNGDMVDLEVKQTEWIPCTERLPEIEREGQRRGWYLTTNGYGCVSLTQYEFYHDLLKTGWQSDIQITAWMPLPEPYKGGE